MASPQRITPQEMYALAVFCILEGADDLRNTAEQLKVAAVIVNRTHSSNWSKQFGASLMDQMFAADKNGDQFEIIKRFGIDRADFASIDSAAKALTEAKPALSLEWAKEGIIAFGRAAGDVTQYTAAATAVGDNTGFRGKKGVGNVFRRESPKYDSTGLLAKQPSNILVDWGKQKPLF